jgi:hypothetical protein
MRGGAVKLSFDAKRFAAAVNAAMKERCWSYERVCHFAPFVNRAMLSRAVNGGHVSLPSYIAVCGGLDLDPFEFVCAVDGINIQLIQPVTVGVSRETSFASRAEGAPAGPRKGSDGHLPLPPLAGAGDTISAQTLAHARRTLQERI